MDDTERVLLTTRKFRVVEVSQRLSDGTHHNREIIRHPGAVVILPLLDQDRVCLIRNFRAAVGRTLLELPAGTLEADELPEQTARRELLEETGFRAQSWELLHTFFPSPGIMDEQMHLFVARQLMPGDAAREPGEQIENCILPWAEAMRQVWQREIVDGKTLVALLLYNGWRQSA